MTELMRLPTRLRLSGSTMGMPPPTAASNETLPSPLSARLKISSPYSASRALLAVTTFLPAFRASRTTSPAKPVPPTSSTTMSISGSSMI